VHDIIVSTKAMIAIIFKVQLRILFSRPVVYVNIHRVKPVVEAI
jgi:hypothetical protein